MNIRLLNGLEFGLGFVLSTAACAAPPPAAGPQQNVLPADGNITITDYGYRDWPASLLHYTVPAGKMKPGPVCLVDAAGNPVPAQVDGDTLAFVTSLAKGGTATFAVGTGKPAAPSLRITKGRDALEIANEFFALRLPPPGKKFFKPAAEAAKVPGPITAWQPARGSWMGATRFVTTRAIVSMEARIIREGPAVLEYETRYRFEPAGEYICRVRVCPGIDHADFAEEYDFGALTEGHDFVMLELQKGFTPATLGRTFGEDLQVVREPFDAFIAEKLKGDAVPTAPVGGQGTTPASPKPEPDMTLLDRILPAWHNVGCGLVELRSATNAGPAGAVARVTVVPIHAGSWRRALAQTIWNKPGVGLCIAMPISTRHITWYSDSADDLSPFSSHEHDPGLKPTYGRREWALCFGEKTDGLQGRIGTIGLDRYKDWILDWPERVGATNFPRAWYTKAQVEHLKKSLDKHPDREVLKKFFVFSGKKEDATANGKTALTEIFVWIKQLDNWNVSGLSLFRQMQWFAGPLSLADDALACPGLEPALRRDLRRALAVIAYQISDPDLNPRGAGVHLGNNNMPMSRTAPLPCSAGLLPDHPLYRYWMDQSAEFFAYKNGSYIAADGAALEAPMYQLYGPLRFMSDAATVVHNTGGPDLTAPLVANGWYLANLTMPDPRFDGRRILPGMGNSANDLESCYGFLIADAERLDPDLAARLQAVLHKAWPVEPISAGFGNNKGMAFRYLSEVPDSPKPLVSMVMPTYGVVFRAHPGTPDETAMLLRIGNAWGHWDPDPLNAILYGKGAPLSPGTGYQYYFGEANKNNAIYHNQVKVGRPDQQEIFGRVDNELRDYGFGSNADYAVASRYYPPEVFEDKPDELEWHRHVLFLKSAQPAGANYFVMRDTFTPSTGSGQASATPRSTWWTWLNLEGPERLKVDGQAFKKEDTTLNQTLPPAKLVVKEGQTLEMATDFGASTWFWFDGKRQFRPRITFDYDVKNSARLGMQDWMYPKLPGQETKTVLEGVGAPGQEWFYVVFPRKGGEPTPQVEKLAAGVLKIVTAESTDYAFVSDTPIEFKRDGVEFAGKAGAVRVFADHVALCLNAGVGRVGYKGEVFSGPGPFEATVALAGLQTGETKLTGEYEKKWQTVEIGDGLTVRGEGPFTATLDGGSASSTGSGQASSTGSGQAGLTTGKRIRIQTDGRTRQLFVTKPVWTDWVQFTVDGEPRMACWTDYPASGWGSYKNTRLIALTVPAGKHELAISDFVYPAVWTRPFVPNISGVELDAKD